MARVAYEIFYDYEGMRKSDPLHDELSKEGVEDRIERLPFELKVIFGDESSNISARKSSKGKNIVFVDSSCNESDIDRCMEKALQGLSLFGSKVNATNETIVK